MKLVTQYAFLTVLTVCLSLGAAHIINKAMSNFIHLQINGPLTSFDVPTDIEE